MGNYVPSPEEVSVVRGGQKRSGAPTYDPTYYISMEEDKSSMVEIQKGEKKATNKTFGVVAPGSGLTIVAPGVMEVKVGKGLKINPDTKNLELFTEEIYPIAGDNISYEKTITEETIINVKGDNTLNPLTNTVPTSKAISSYTRKITGNLSSLNNDLQEFDETTIVDVLNTLHRRSYYTHSQATPSTEWVIDHPLKKNPSVIVIDETGEEIIGDVEYPSLHQVIVRFSAGFSGSAFLN